MSQSTAQRPEPTGYNSSTSKLNKLLQTINLQVQLTNNTALLKQLAIYYEQVLSLEYQFKQGHIDEATCMRQINAINIQINKKT